MGGSFVNSFWVIALGSVAEPLCTTKSEKACNQWALCRVGLAPIFIFTLSMTSLQHEAPAILQRDEYRLRMRIKMLCA